MLDLIARLEAATGPDRELDVAIAFAIGEVRDRDDNYLYATDNESDMVVEPNPYDTGLSAQPLRYFTSSIDAALTLVPANTQWDLHRVHDPHSGDKPYFYSSINEPQVWYGATPAIAICIAALRRRASAHPSNVRGGE